MPEPDTSAAAVRLCAGLLLLPALPVRAQVPAFSSHPCDEMLSAGDRLVLSAALSPAPAQWRWLKNEVPVPGAAGPELVIPSVKPEDTAFYRCAGIIGNSQVWSLPARVTVLERQVQPGDADPGFAKGAQAMTVNALIPAPGGGWFAGGTGGVVRLEADGRPAAGFLAPVLDHEVLCLTLQGNVLWAGGRFTGRLLRLDAGTGRPLVMQVSGADGEVFCLATGFEGKVFAGGSFTAISGQARPKLAAFGQDGTLDPAFNGTSALQPDGDVTSLAVQQGDGAVLVGGRFLRLAGRTQFRLARVSAAGVPDTGFAQANWPDREVQAIAVDSAGRVLIGGPFLRLKLPNGTGGEKDGPVHRGLMRLSSTGLYDPGFLPLFEHPVLPVTVRSISAGAGRIAACGDFAKVSNLTAPCLVILGDNGLPDASLVPTTGFSGPSAAGLVRAVRLTEDGGAAAGGSFTAPGPGLVKICGTPAAAPPRITLPWEMLTMTAGAPCELRASVTGWPLPVPQWRHNGAPVTAERGAVTSAAASLSHSGEYSVSAEPEGRTTVEVTVPGYGEPRWHGYAPAAGLPLAVPNDTSAVSTLTVPDNFPVGRAAVRVSLQHAHFNTLRITLTAPGGAASPVRLLDASDLTDASIPRRRNADGLRFDAASGIPLQAARAPWTATVQAADQAALKQLAGRASAGEWKLTVSDRSALDGIGGSLISWQLELLEIPAAPTFASWAAALPSGLRGPTDDADGDGLTNLTEYAYPEPTGRLTGGAPLWFLEEARRSDPALLFLTEVSDDLLRWEAIVPQSQQDIFLPDHTSAVRLLLPPNAGPLSYWRGRVR